MRWLLLMASVAIGGDGGQPDESTTGPPESSDVTIEDTAAIEARLDAQLAIVDELIATVMARKDRYQVPVLVSRPVLCSCPPTSLLRPPVTLAVSLSEGVRPVRTLERGPTP